MRFSPPVTLQIITQGQLLTWQYLNKMDMERMVLTNLAAPDFFGKKNIVQWRISFRTVWSKVAVKKLKKQVTKLCRTKRNRINGYLEQRQVKYTCFEPRKFAIFDTTSNEFGTCQDICRNFSATPQKCAQHVLRFPELIFSSTRLVELLLWLHKSRLNPTTWFGKRHG